MRSPDEVKKFANTEKALPSQVPYSSQVANGVVKLKKGAGYLATLELEGVDFETCGEPQIDIYKTQLQQALLSLSGGVFALWSHKVRRKVSEHLEDHFTDPFCQSVSDAYKANLADTVMMRTSLYVTLIYRPNQIANFKSVGLGNLKAFTAFELENIASLEEALDQFTASLARYKPRRLVNYTENNVAYSELLSFLGYLLNGFWERFPVSDKVLDVYLCASRLTFGERNGVIEIDHAEGKRYASALELQEFPSEATALQLSELLYAEHEFIETQSFSILNNREGVKNLSRQRGRMLSGGEASVDEIRMMDVVIDEVLGNRLVVGEFHYSLTVFSKSLDTLIKDRSIMKALLEGGGFKAVAQTTVPEAAWFYQMPGNWSQRTRVAIITSFNFACFSPFHSFMSGKRIGNPWGEALAYFSSPSGQPFFLNFHTSPEDHDNTDDKLPANTNIFGATGVGKTTLEMFLVAMLDKFGATILFFDKDRGAEIALRAMGAKYTAFQRGVRTGINPFQWEEFPSPDYLRFLKQLVALCLTRGKGDLPADEQIEVDKAVNTVMGLRYETRRLGLVSQNINSIGENSLQARLSRWVGQGELAWLLDNPKDTLELSSNTRHGWDYTELIDDPEVCSPFVMCLLQAAETMQDGRRIAIFMEEFWKPLQYPVFAEFVRNKLKTIRKLNGFVVLVTQQPDDILKHDLAKTAVQQSVTGIYLPNPKADRDDYVNGFKLTEAEFEIIKSLPENSRCFLIKQDKKSAVVRFDLSGLDDVITILSGSADNVMLLDDIRARVGDDREAWAPELLEQVNARRANNRKTKEAIRANS